jgi:hypothetical protein
MSGEQKENVPLTQKMTELAKLKSVWLVVSTLVAGSFAAGAGLASFTSLPNDMANVRADTRALACMFVAAQENTNSRYCESFLSDETRLFVDMLRRGTIPFAPAGGDVMEPKQREWPYKGSNDEEGFIA